MDGNNLLECYKQMITNRYIIGLPLRCGKTVLTNKIKENMKMGIEFTICETGEIQSYTWGGFTRISGYILNYYHIKGYIVPPIVQKWIFADNETRFTVEEIKQLHKELTYVLEPINEDLRKKWDFLLQFLDNAIKSDSMIITT